jgi:hypothetical protein
VEGVGEHTPKDCKLIAKNRYVYFNQLKLQGHPSELESMELVVKIL